MEIYSKEGLKAGLRERLEDDRLAWKLVRERKPIKELGQEDLGRKEDDKEAAGVGLESFDKEAIDTNGEKGIDQSQGAQKSRGERERRSRAFGLW